MASANFTSTIQTVISIEDGSTFVESVQSSAPIDCTISFKTDLNKMFSSVRMPDARTNDEANVAQDYYDFPDGIDKVLREHFLDQIDPNWHKLPFGVAATHPPHDYLEQVKIQLRHLFDNMSVDGPSGVLRIDQESNSVVRLKNEACVKFLIEKTEGAENLAMKTFIGTQLVELCEASARDAMRYSVNSRNGDHHLALRPGDSWTVRVEVKAKGAAATDYTNTQLWAINIEQE